MRVKSRVAQIVFSVPFNEDMIVHLISSPRTISTALMYAFYNRDDFNAVDEPLYARYLDRTGKDHPGAEEILRSQPINEEEVFRKMSEKNDKHLFVKNMASHLEDVNMDLYDSFKNVILFRDPGRIIYSFSKVIKEPRMDDLGIKLSYEIFKELQSREKDVIAINSDNLLNDPKKNLELICDHMGLHMSDKMLAWPVGPKPVDGVWARHWYDNVHKSTGFISRKKEDSVLPIELNDMYQEALPYYNYLTQHSII